jgi:hypothetical protein
MPWNGGENGGCQPQSHADGQAVDLAWLFPGGQMGKQQALPRARFFGCFVFGLHKE